MSLTHSFIVLLDDATPVLTRECFLSESILSISVNITHGISKKCSKGINLLA